MLGLHFDSYNIRDKTTNLTEYLITFKQKNRCNITCHEYNATTVGT